MVVLQRRNIIVAKGHLRSSVDLIPAEGIMTKRINKRSEGTGTNVTGGERLKTELVEN